MEDQIHHNWKIINSIKELWLKDLGLGVEGSGVDLRINYLEGEMFESRKGKERSWRMY